jgi:hypothetical protein
METGETPQAAPRKEPTRVEHTISGYADESITPKVVVCAAAIFPVTGIAAAEAALASLKTGLGLPSTTSLHCRVIFHSQARRGTPWESIDPRDINSSIVNLCRNLTRIGLRPVVVVAPNSSLLIPGKPGAESEGTPLDEKGQAAIGFQTLSFHLAQLHGFGAVKLWIDPDTTKIRWLNGKAQANLTRSSFMDLGPDIEPPRSEPVIPAGEAKPPLLEVADLYAYVAARAHSAEGGWKDRWFQMVYSVINPEQLLWGSENQDPKLQNA